MYTVSSSFTIRTSNTLSWECIAVNISIRFFCTLSRAQSTWPPVMLDNSSPCTVAWESRAAISIPLVLSGVNDKRWYVSTTTASTRLKILSWKSSGYESTTTNMKVDVNYSVHHKHCAHSSHQSSHHFACFWHDCFFCTFIYCCSAYKINLKCSIGTKNTCNYG